MKHFSPKVSIIIPVYNVSQYLRKCLDSVVNQTLEEIEIIIVNDCSPNLEDDKICQEYIKKDKRIVYLKHTQNLKQGGARNTGIKLAKAKYIAFLDSDDWVDLDMYKQLYQQAISSEAEIIVCGYYRVYNNNLITGREFLPQTIFNFNHQVNIYDINLDYAPWNKIWKKTIFIENNIFYPNYLYYEDMITVKLLYYAKKISFISGIYYYYLQQDNSTTRKITKKNIEDNIIMWEDVDEFMRRKNLSYIYINQLFYSMITNINKILSRIQGIKNQNELLIYFFERIKQIPKLKFLTKKPIFFFKFLLFFFEWKGRWLLLKKIPWNKKIKKISKFIYNYLS